MKTATVNPSRVKDLRLKAGMSQEDVAFAMKQHGHKTNAQSIARWEKGLHAPHTNVIPALASALNVTIEELYSSSDEDESDEEAAMLDLVLEAALALDKAGSYAMADALRMRARAAGRKDSGVAA